MQPQPPVFLSELLRHLPYPVTLPEADPPVTGVVADSRQVRRGDLFVAIRGVQVDGHRFIEAAIARGASAVVGTEPHEGLPVPYIRVRDGREALAYLVAAFYGHPSRQMTLIGVTGTDGKTTTTNLIFHILKAAGLDAGMISTVSPRTRNVPRAKSMSFRV